MGWISIAVFLLISGGVICITEVKFADITSLFTRKKKSTLSEDIGIVTGKKKRRFIAREVYEVEQILKATGREEKFEAIKKLCFLMFGIGVLISILIGNIYLIPALGTGLALAPLWYIRSTAAIYKKNLNEQMESALSIITTSYLRTEDFIKSVRENIPYISSPIKDTFEMFLMQSDLIDANIISSVNSMKLKTRSAIFHEWCDCIIQCQSERSMKYLLVGIIQKFSDIRIVQSELEALISAPKREAFMMMFLVLCNIPLLYVLNDEWFHTLVFTLPGKITLAICAIILLFSLTRIMALSRPIEYRGESE